MPETVEDIPAILEGAVPPPALPAPGPTRVFNKAMAKRKVSNQLPNPGYNYTYAFALYASGARIPQISAELGIPRAKLDARAQSDSWPTLLREFAYVFKPGVEKKTPEDPKLEAKFKKIEINRKSVVDLATVLREKIVMAAAIFDKMDQNAMADPEVLANVAKSIGTLTKAAKDISDMTMVALGDENVIRHLGAGFNAPGGNKSGPSIVINMPGALANSRRAMKLVGDTVDKAGGILVAAIENGHDDPDATHQ